MKVNKLYAQTPEDSHGWQTCGLESAYGHAGSQNISRRWQEHLSGKLKEHGFVQDERDPCLSLNTELDICIGVHVDDMLAVGPSELMQNLLQELSKDMTMRW